MKATVLPTVCAGLLLACAEPAPPPPPDWAAQIRDANEQLLNQGNIAAAAEMIAPQYVAHLTGGDTSGGPDVIGAFVTQLRTAFPDLRVDVQILVTEGDRVAWVRRHRGTQQGDFQGVSANGRLIEWQDMIVTRFEAGKIAEEWAVSDLGERLRMQPAPDSTSTP